MDDLQNLKSIPILTIADRLQISDLSLIRTGQNTTQKIYFSDLFQEHYTINEYGRIIFDSGAEYSKNEIALIKNSSPDTIKVIHKLKTIFKGEVKK